MAQEISSKTKSQLSLDVLIVGAGFAGMYMLHELRRCGFKTLVIERGDGVGGTWYWNRYPGARCDVESVEYSYSWSKELEQDWTWTERYSGQPEILDYANHVADRFDLRKDIHFNTELSASHFDESTNRWQSVTKDGRAFQSKYLIMATGCLSSANMPAIDGIEDFKGDTYHTGRWPHEKVDFSGKDVGIIGTGSSAIQSIPIIAQEAKHLTVFQRTPNFSVPARNRGLRPDEIEHVKATYADLRTMNKLMPGAFGSRQQMPTESVLEVEDSERQQKFSERWQHGGFSFLGSFNDLTLNQESNEIAAEFVREQIRETVKDPVTAEKLCPTNTIGCKRLCLDTNYFETYNRENVSLVDIDDDPIQRLTHSGIQTTSTEFNFDAIVFATGFDAMTGTLLRVDLKRRSGLTLSEKWREGPKNYLGLLIHGFPNLFMISGPGSPSVLTNMIASIEQHVEWIRDCLTYLRDNGHSTIEAESEAEEQWVAHVNAVADMTLYPTCNSWYLGANIPGKPRVFMPHVGFPNYVEKCVESVNADYQGFALG